MPQRVAIPPEAIPDDPERKVGIGPTMMFTGTDLSLPPDVIYTDDRVEKALTARGWTSARRRGHSDPEYDGDAWAFDTETADVLSPSRAYAHLTANTIEVEAADGIGIPTRSYKTLDALLADIEEIEAWPHERDVFAGDDVDVTATLGASGLLRETCSACGAPVRWVDPAELAHISKETFMEYKRSLGVDVLLGSDAWVCTACYQMGVVTVPQ